ncbi:MAG TPA: DUF2785 domain-containing protein [Candidatus Polarisedimenticolia bacterium]|nr:DUF2785 domain-containing protein [Candidatus Polarisedimenticolia bacterium]
MSLPSGGMPGREAGAAGRMPVRWTLALMLGALLAASGNAPARAEAPPEKAVASQTPAAPPEKSAHDREFWRTIAKNKFAPPAGQPITPLLRELSGLLGSADPELRDDLAYTITDQWVRHQEVPAADLNALADAWRENLRFKIGETGTDSVFTRSFSALCLASLARREQQVPFLGPERYQALLNEGLTYLKQERDLRGFDPVKGWIHATAHTADLLANLAGNGMLRKEDQARLLEAISQRLSSAGQIFSYGEQDRLSLIAATLAMRNDFDAQAFNRWLTAVSGDQRVWNDSPPRVELLQTFENNTYMLQALAAHLSAPETPPLAEARKSLLQVLRRR